MDTLFQIDNPKIPDEIRERIANDIAPDVIGNNWDLDGEKNAERWWFV